MPGGEFSRDGLGGDAADRWPPEPHQRVNAHQRQWIISWAPRRWHVAVPSDSLEELFTRRREDFLPVGDRDKAELGL